MRDFKTFNCTNSYSFCSVYFLSNCTIWQLISRLQVYKNRLVFMMGINFKSKTWSLPINSISKIACRCCHQELVVLIIKHSCGIVQFKSVFEKGEESNVLTSFNDINLLILFIYQFDLQTLIPKYYLYGCVSEDDKISERTCKLIL